MLQAWVLVFIGLVMPSAVVAERNVRFEGDFESGEVQDAESHFDGFRIRTLPEEQVGGAVSVIAKGGADTRSKLDTRVALGEIVSKRGELSIGLVRPRRGRYFLRSAIFATKDYSALQGGLNKPRSAINVSGTENGVDFDEEGYIGFSIYLPNTWEHETGTRGSRGSTQLLQVQSEGASWTLLTLRVYVPKGESTSRWFLTHHFSDRSTTKGKVTEYDLGSVVDDLGRWTDFVLRYRFNPFSVTTDASSIDNGKSRVYEGNRGILQLWKARGPVDADGNRQMYLTTVNLVNEPVGLVPHASEKISWHFRIYKYGWHRNPSSVEGPVWVGFDEIRDGRVLEDGTTYRDAHPAGLACTDRCPETKRPSEIRDVKQLPKSARGMALGN